MRTIRRGLEALGAALLSALTATGCHAPAAPPTAAPAVLPAPTPAPPHAFRTLSEAEPALVAAEDRRAFDASVLGAAAASGDPAVRARGALALGRIGDARALAPLGTLMEDREAPVRQQAAFAAGILGEAGTTGALVRLLDDADAAVSARAAWSLGMVGGADAERALVAAVAAATAAPRRAALLRGLWRFGDPAAAAAAEPFARDPDPEVRAAALYVLARRPQAGSLATLTAALADPDAQTAALCARGLGVLGNAESAGPLLTAVETGPVPVKINALAALAAVLQKNPGTPLPADRRGRVLALSSDVNPNLAVPALALLRWAAEDRDVFRRLWSVASTGQERRQQVALQALMGGLGAGSDELVDAAMASPDPHLRAAVAESLGMLPEADAAPRRARLSEDVAVVVRLKVLEGLRSASDARSSREIIDRLRADADAGVRAAALDALALSEAPALFAILREAVVASYGDPGPDVPISAIGAAEKSPDDAGARAVVEAAYRHPSTLVSRLARRSLVKTFHADPAAYPWREYATGRSVADYAALLAEARRPWRLDVETSRGGFTARLDGASAPLTVMNILKLAGKEYFDGAPVHRVVPNFVVQDGDPTGTGNGGPGYEIRDELTSLPYATGTVGMALAGPDTGGSQWFVTQAPEPHLDGAYTVFGQVVSGMDVVLRIEQGDRIVRIAASAAK